ncbi:hypothetical protein EMEDMD4_760016 [Sinorhizobium medicae]|uniref:Uncharacterized protein n=1 Tax=Sinorhizobium medicae TaxID=110321 RepID=A0A508X7N3_9HYPH|nr:hypothetical protein EMEDMD4_760016 [Sinorhizobium medicae]
MRNPKRLERKLDKLAGRVNRSRLAKELISALSNLGQLARLRVNVEESGQLARVSRSRDTWLCFSYLGTNTLS